jgi:hypothetical protein
LLQDTCRDTARFAPVSGKLLIGVIYHFGAVAFVIDITKSPKWLPTGEGCFKWKLNWGLQKSGLSL